MRRLALALVLALGSAVAHAQMPDLRTMNGKPLPVADLPAGTVTVRVARKMPVNAAAGIDVEARVVGADGSARVRKAKTGDDGRATFEGLTVGATFSATAVVDGETLSSAAFPVPAQGGTRIMLIAGLGAAGPSDGEEPAEGAGFDAMMMTGTLEPAADLPLGTIEVVVQDAGGKPVAGRRVLLGQVGSDKQLKASSGNTNAEGIARFENLPTDDTGYVTLADFEGRKIGTQPFRLPSAGGMRARLAPPAVTSDTSGLRLDPRSRLAFEPREEALLVYEMLSIQNLSGKVVDGGTAGILIPLPSRFENAQALDRESPIDARPKEGMVIRAPIPPTAPGGANAMQVRFAFFLPNEGETSVKLVQPMPWGISRPLFIVPADAHLTLSGPGLQRAKDEKDPQGRVMQLYEMGDIPPGGTITLTVGGLPVQSRAGHTLVAALATLLIAAGVFAAVRARKDDDVARRQVDLTARREKLFAELVEHVRKKPDGAAAADAWKGRRQELVGKLEIVYRDLAALERQAG